MDRRRTTVGQHWRYDGERIVLHRRDGFRHGLIHGFDVMVEMDSDLQHDPAALPALLAAVADGADLAIGSRYVPGGSIPSAVTSRNVSRRIG